MKYGNTRGPDWTGSPVVWAIFALGIVVLFYALIEAVAQGGMVSLGG